MRRTIKQASRGNVLAILSLSALGGALIMSGCGDFSADDGSGTGGSDAGTGGADAGTGGTVIQEPPPEASCDNVNGCGGDVAGVWFAVGSCLPVSGKADLTAHGIGCVEADVEGTLEVTGNWTIAEDGTMTDTTQTTGTVHFVLQPECLDVSGTVAQCDTIAGPLMASMGLVRAESSCEVSETVVGGCDCIGVLNQAGSAAFPSTNISADVLYETVGNTLTVTGFEELEYDYCIDGNFMHVTPTTENDIGTVTGTVVFQRQP